MSRTRDHEELIESSREIPPGVSETLGLFSMRRAAPFRIESASPVDGIDYAAFTVRALFIGARSQWGWMHPNEERPVVSLFNCWPALDILYAPLSLTLIVVNRSDRPQRFAIKLVGKELIG